MSAEDDLFESDRVRSDLRGHVVRGGAVSIIAQGIKMLLRIGGLAVLARILTPADFGLVTMVLVALELLDLLGDFGLGQAVVQKEDLSSAQLSAAFWISAVLGVVLGGVTVGIAPVLAWAYDEPALIPLTLALAIRFPLVGLGAQHLGLLQRRMRLGAIALVETLAMVGGLVAAILAATQGLGVWALVLRWVVQPALMTLGWWIAASWRPGGWRRSQGVHLRSLLEYGGNLTLTRVLIYISRNADNFLIGRLFGAAQTGLYSRAYQLLLLPQTQITFQIGRAVIPALSRLQDQAAAYRNTLLKATATTTLLAVPFVILSVVHAREMVLLLLGAQWIEAAPMIRVLAIAAFLQTTTVPADWNFMARGRTREMRQLYLFVVPLTVAGFVVGSRWGVYGVAASYAITVTATTPVFVWVSLRRSPVSFHAMIATILRTATPSLLAGVAMWFTREALLRSPQLEAIGASTTLAQLALLGAGFVVGAAAMLLTAAVWPPLREDVLALVRVVDQLRRPKS